jgi:hypothetical protein
LGKGYNMINKRKLVLVMGVSSSYRKSYPAMNWLKPKQWAIVRLEEHAPFQRTLDVIDVEVYSISDNSMCDNKQSIYDFSIVGTVKVRGE